MHYLHTKQINDRWRKQISVKKINNHLSHNFQTTNVFYFCFLYTKLTSIQA